MGMRAMRAAVEGRPYKAMEGRPYKAMEGRPYKAVEGRPYKDAGHLAMGAWIAVRRMCLLRSYGKIYTYRRRGWGGRML